MMNRQQIHRIIDEMPETELGMLSRLIEGMQATRPMPEPARPPKHGSARVGMNPMQPPAALMPPQNHSPLSSQYSTMLEQEAPDNRSMLRKVMFCRVSDLMTWVNRGQEPGKTHL